MNFECGIPGKSAVLKVRDAYAEQIALSSSKPAAVALFCVDADYDDFCNPLANKSYTVQTCHYNVEAEIFAHARGTRWLTLTLGLEPDDFPRVHGIALDPVGGLAATWREWINLCLAARFNASTGTVKPKRVSQINHDTFGLVNPDRLQEAEDEIWAKRDTQSRVRPFYLSVSNARRILDASDKDTRERPVNGKHIPSFLKWQVSQVCPNARTASGDALAAAALMTLDFTDRWANFHLAQIDAIAAQY